MSEPTAARPVPRAEQLGGNRTKRLEPQIAWGRILIGSMSAGLGFALLACFPVFVGEWEWNLPLFAIALLAMLACWVASLGLLFRPLQPAALACVGFGCVFVPTCFVVAWSSYSLRDFALARCARRSEPLVAAIHAFERTHESPPKYLGELVPAFLPEVPHTGMRAYPDYEYQASHDLEPARWELRVECGWDLFLYRPTRDYVDSPSVVRFGDWALYRD